MNDAAPPDASGPHAGAIAAGRQRWARVPDNVRGGFWVIVSAGFYAATLALIKIAGATLHVAQILFLQQIFMLALALPLIVRGLPESLRTARPGLQAARIALAGIAMLCSYTAVIHLPLADVITITFSRTFFITVFAIVLLGEAVGARRWAATVVGFAGVLLAAQPDGVGSLNVYGLMAIAAAACLGLVMIIIRILARTDRPATILSYQAVGIAVLSAGPALWFWTAPTAAQWLLLAGIGAVTAGSQLCNILGFRVAEASALAPLDYVRFVYAVAIGVLVFSQWPSPQVLLGAAIIVGAGLYSLDRERRTARARAL